MSQISKMSLGLAFLFLLSGPQLKANPMGLGDLGMEKTSLADLEAQKKLEQRRYFLEQHQLWGLVSIAGMLATINSAEEGQLAPEHALFAGITAGAYGAAAYYGWAAPTIPGTKEKGQTQWHKYLTWIHFPAMVLTIAAGVQAAKDRRDGQPLEGLGKQHRNLQSLAAGSLALSVALVSFEF